MGRLKMSGNMPAEVAERLSDVYVPEVEFDEWNNDHMGDAVPAKRLHEPIRQLLVLESQIKATEDSFGVNAERLAEMVIPMLKDLRRACKEEWEANGF